MSSQIARKVIGLFRQVAPPPRAEHDLTPQELRLLGLFSEGYSYQGVAEELGISVNTVRSHVRNVYDKLHVHSRSQAVHAAIRQGILQGPEGPGRRMPAAPPGRPLRGRTRLR
ncbi:MAG: response regulator transcription factor [Thermoanaerobaculia bacterium]